MIRIILELIGIFLIPFIIYGLAVIMFGHRFRDRQFWHWSHMGGLALMGLVFVGLSFLIFGMTSPRYDGPYRPAHIENGRLVPGTAQ